jgi:hypothetical protein
LVVKHFYPNTQISVKNFSALAHNLGNVVLKINKTHLKFDDWLKKLGLSKIQPPQQHQKTSNEKHNAITLEKASSLRFPILLPISITYFIFFRFFDEVTPLVCSLAHKDQSVTPQISIRRGHQIGRR